MLENKNMENEDQNLEIHMVEFLKDVSKKLSLNDDQENILKNEFMDLIGEIINQLNIIYENQTNENPNQDLADVKDKIINTWGSNVVANKTFAQRALKWIGLESLEDVNGLDLFKFINKMVDLGKLLSEDNYKILNKENYLLSKEEAINLRDKLMKDGDFFNILSDKSHIKNKQAKDKFNYLNKIIATN